MGSSMTDERNNEIIQLIRQVETIARAENRLPEDVLKDAIAQYKQGKGLAE